ncbi:hypothetical protein [Hungatella effluvii]|uniref:hypothetical protein n=1 Tax=Hungatella effluvii TaxID=1096246 RepID=UPI0036F3E34D
MTWTTSTTDANGGVITYRYNSQGKWNQWTAAGNPYRQEPTGRPGGQGVHV